MTMITVSELKDRLESEDLVVIDVREPWEYEEHNIGATNIPLTLLPEKLEELEELKSKEVVVHCQSGKRSHQARKYLAMHGFEKVKSLVGGLQAFEEEESEG